jgi:signal transduction histidine kinase
MGMPMRTGGRVVGVLSILREETYPHFNVEEITLLTSIANQMGVVVESAQLRHQAEQTVVMEERARLARELHDSVTQLLYSMNLFAKSGQNAYDHGDQDELKVCLTELGESAQQALKEMRLLVYELRPPILEQDGLIGALQNRLDTVEGRVGINTRLLTGETFEIPKQIQGELYHIALEALNNSLKHAQATEVTVKIDITEVQIKLEITDNGSGFDPETTKDGRGFGLDSMRERADSLGGILNLTSNIDEGTTVCVNINLAETR